jgi:hypothetical protein
MRHRSLIVRLTSWPCPFWVERPEVGFQSLRCSLVRQWGRRDDCIGMRPGMYGVGAVRPRATLSVMFVSQCSFGSPIFRFCEQVLSPTFEVMVKLEVIGAVCMFTWSFG